MSDRSMLQSPLVDLALPAAAHASSRDAAPSIRELVQAHSDFVWRSLRRLGVPEHLVDDATQQVFLIAAGKLEAIRPGCERSFLFGALGNVAAHVRRSLARGREQPQASVVETVDPSPQPDELIAQRQTRALLDEVLDALPTELRTVFILFELEELPAPEVAELTGLALGTVASRLRRAREEFHKAAKRVRANAAWAARGRP
jgi:RNA polymerase sigma-70 factor (ECF subfamily)